MAMIRAVFVYSFADIVCFVRKMNLRKGVMLAVRKTKLSFLIAGAALLFPAVVSSQTILWDQPLSSVNTHPYHNQDYDDQKVNESDIWIADDFENTETWHISSIFVPGEFVTDIYNASTIGNANFLRWYIYEDTGGRPNGFPKDGVTTPVWSISLHPLDPQISITKGTNGNPANVTLNLASPIRLSPGQYWLIYSPEIKATFYGEHGRQPSDTENGFGAQIIQPSGVDGFPTVWTSARDPIVPWVTQRFPALTLQDFAFRLEGSSFSSDVDTEPRALTFDNVLTGQTSGSKTVSISNIGGTSVVISSIITSDSDFVVATSPVNGCSLTNHTLASGSSCNVSVTFSPSVAGQQSASLDVITNLNPALAQVLLSGTGVDAETDTIEGTIGTVLTFTNASSGFTNKKGKVLIYDGAKKISTKIAKGAWTNNTITSTVNKAFLPGTYEVRIEFKRDKKREVFEAGTFTFRKPLIDSITATEGAPGDPITINGNFFSTKKGKVCLEYEKNGKSKNKNCRVTYWSMNRISFLVPKTSKSFSLGVYPLKVINKVGTTWSDTDFIIH